MGEDETLICYLDGDNLCITRKDFIDLQASSAVFIPLTSQQIDRIKELQRCDY